MAAKAVAFREALSPTFRDYAARIVDNARLLAEGLLSRGLHVLTGGTDNHLILVDVQRTFGLTGRQAESALRECGLTLNRNSIPFDPNGPWYTSGLRLGTAATTTLGMGAAEMGDIADIFATVLRAVTPITATDANGKQVQSKAKFALGPTVAAAAKERARELISLFPVYREIDLETVLGCRFVASALA
jgi:glycine hydroxymethyltransferase